MISEIILPYVAQMVKNPLAKWETWVRSLGWEDPLEEGMAIHSSILAWKIPMDREACQATVRGITELDMTGQLSAGPRMCKSGEGYSERL